MKKQKCSNLRRWWLDLSISTKSICLQSVLILVPMVICLFLLFNRIYLEASLNTAESSYQYSRYAIDSFESQIRQLKSATNVVLMSSRVSSFLSTDDLTASDELQKNVDDLLNYTIATRSTIQEMTLYSTEFSGQAAKRSLPMWPSTSELGTLEDNIGGRWRFVPRAEGGGRAASLVQTIYQNNLPVGALQVRFLDQQLDKTVDSIASIVGGYSLACLRDGTIVYQSAGGGEISTERLNAFPAYPEGYHVLDDQRIASIAYCDSMDLVIVSVRDFQPSYSLNQTQTTYFVVVFAVFILTAAFAIWLQHISITKRITRLSDQITKVTSIDALKPVDSIEGADELGALTRNYNAMLTRIAELARNAQTAQMLHQIAKYSALQAQIQPHFLYNTLETLRMMADEHDDPEVADMLFIFGKLLRNSISGKEQETTLGRELENIQNYLCLNKLRIQSLRYEVVCETKVEDMICPRFILQPLVENSIHHGISNSRKTGHIHVRVYEQGPYVYIDVSDNGAGITPARLSQLHQALSGGASIQQSQGGIGISNVNARLKMYYGEESGLEISSEPGIMTVCRVRILPKRKENA